MEATTKTCIFCGEQRGEGHTPCRCDKRSARRIARWVADGVPIEVATRDIAGTRGVNYVCEVVDGHLHIDLDTGMQIVPLWARRD